MKDRLKQTLAERLPLFETSAPYLAAYGCARAWTTLVVVQTDQDLPIPFLGSHQLFDLAYCLVAVLAFILVSKRPLPIALDRACTRGSFVGMLAGSALSLVASQAGDPNGTVATAGSLCCGIGYSLFLLSWAQALRRLSLVKIVAFTAASMFAASVLVYFANGMDDQRFAALTLALPFASFALMSRLHARKDTDNAEVSWTEGSLRSYPWKLYLLFGAYSFAYGLHGEAASMGAGMHSSLSTAIVSLAIVGFVVFSGDKASVRILYRSPLPLVICGFLLVPTSSMVGSTISSYLISMSYTLMSVIVSLILYDISKRLGIAIVALIGLKIAEQLFVVLGQWSYSALEVIINPAYFKLSTSALILVIMLSQTFILRSEKDLNARWGVSLLQTGSLDDATDELLRVAARCDEITAQYRLSPREDEILRLMAQGKSGREISQELFIAEGTYKAHSQHIYTKLDIHSRKELFVLLGLPPSK